MSASAILATTDVRSGYGFPKAFPKTLSLLLNLQRAFTDTNRRIQRYRMWSANIEKPQGNTARSTMLFFAVLIN